MLGDGNIHTIWVYRVFRNKHGKEETVPKLMEGDPKELQVESQILAQWGPGKYRVIGRDRNHKLVGGAQRVFRFEDENGHVPEELDEPPITGAGASGAGPAIGGAGAEVLAVNATLREQIKLLEGRITTELAAAEKRRESDITTMGGLNTELIKVFGGQQRTEGGGEYEKFLRHKVDTLEADLRAANKELGELRTKSLEQGWKITHREGAFQYEKKLIEEGLPRALTILDRWLDKSTKGPAGAASEGGDVMQLPSLESLRTMVTERRDVPVKTLQSFLRLREQKALAPDLEPLVLELSYQAGLIAEVPNVTPSPPTPPTPPTPPASPLAS